MKRVFMIMVCLLSMVLASTGLKAQEISILLRPGWNWIGYPYPETVDLETAFGDFEPMLGDMIESSYGYSEYTTELGWFGEVTNLRPGWGYLYYSNRTESVTIVFSHPSTPVGSVTVTTSEPTLITAISAMGGGEVTTTDGTYIIVKGLCWAAHENPTTNDDFYEEAESGVGTFSVKMTGLNISTTYYVRAYAVTPNGTVYGNQLSFTTTNVEYGYVDLGLPSGLLWATCNVGADNPEDYGDYFAWGETQPKDTYNWETYQYSNGSFFYGEGEFEPYLTKYCTIASCGYNGFTDNLTTLLPEDDAATANWGPSWRMPTKEEWQELLGNTTVTWIQQNGVNGRLFTAANGNSLFLPAAGSRWLDEFSGAGSYGRYWSSSLDTGYLNSHAWRLYFYSGDASVTRNQRAIGFSVRPVLAN